MSQITDQCILDGLRQAYYNLAVSGVKEYSINGRMLRKSDLPEIQKQIVFFEARIDAVSNPGIGGGTVMVQFGDPSGINWGRCQ